LLVVAKDSQYGFHRLIRSFWLSVGLGVIRGTHILFDFQLGAEFFEELWGELRVSIRYDSFGKACVGEHMVSEEPRDFLAPHVFSARDQNYGLRTIMIGDGENCIAAVWFG
jgi:hypothetical protein